MSNYYMKVHLQVVLEGDEKENDNSYHVVFTKGQLPDYRFDYSRYPSVLDRTIPSWSRKLYLLFRGYEEHELQEIKEFSRKFYYFCSRRDYKPYEEFIVKPKTKKEDKNVGRSKTEKRGSKAGSTVRSQAKRA